MRGVHAHERSKERGEECSPVSRLHSCSCSFARLARFARRTIKKRETARILGWLPYMGCRFHKMVTHGEKTQKGSAGRRERGLALSLACVSGDLAASAVVFWRRSRVKIGSKARRDFTFHSLRMAGPSPTKYPRHNNPTSYVGYTLPHAAPWLWNAWDS